MKTIIYITLFLSGNFCFSQNLAEKKYYLSDTKVLSNIKPPASYVFESPDGKYICFSDENQGQLFIKKNTTNGLPKLFFSSNGCGYFPAWSSDSKSLFMKSKMQSGKEIKNETKQYVIKTNKIVKREDIDFRTIQSFNNIKSNTDPLVYINEKLQLIKTDRTSNINTVLEGNKICYQPVLSPNRQKVAVHIGNEIWVYDMNIKEKPRKIGNGLVTSWSLDSKILAGFIDVSEDGHQISNSELYLYDIQNQKTMQLTNTEDVIEMNPSFSQDGKKIYYINSKNGTIIISELKTY